MSERIYGGLRAVRRRQAGQGVARGVIVGLLVSSVAGIVLGLGRWLADAPVAPGLAVAVLLAGPVIGLLIALVRRPDWHAAALAVDQRYKLKDRSATALDFLARREPSALHALQVEDAARHLDGVEPAAVVPFRLPRAWPYAALALAMALTLLVWPLAPRRVQAGPASPLPSVVEQAEIIGEDLKQLDELARKEREKGLEKLVAELREKVEELKEPGVDVREALAKISEMQAAIASAQAQYNVGLVDAQLQSLGEAMAPAQALEAAGKALIEAKFDKAAEQLEAMEAPELDHKEAKAVEEKMKPVAEALGDVGLGQLGAAASEMADGLKGGASGKFRKGSRELARLVKGHSSRRKIKEILDIELAKLSECKGNCNSDKTARIRLKTKSESPSENWGASISGNVFGKKTDPKANRERKEITGNPGDGPSEVETTHSPEGRQLAARGYREMYQKYQKMSEAVLDSEPIPLGHRQTIRRYFELIRPRNVEPGSAEVETGAVPSSGETTP